MFGVDVCHLPATGGSFGVVLAGLFVLVIGVMLSRWVRRSSARLSFVVAPLVLLGGLTLVPLDDPCAQVPAPALAVVEQLPAAATPLVAVSQLAMTDDISVTFGGFKPGEFVQLIVASTPQVIASGYADAQGFVTLTGTIPTDLATGKHTLAVYAPVSGVGFSQPITVVASPTTTTVAPTTVAPTTVAPTTVAPTTVVPTTTVAPTTTLAPVALTPLFDVPTRTGTGFTVQITNYDPSYVWAMSLDQMGVKSISNTGLVTVGGIAYSTSVTATITTTSTDNLTSSADITTSALSTCEAAVSCVVGDTGPGGGYVFFVDVNRPAGSQYFEVACAGWANNCDGSKDPVTNWGCEGTVNTGADGTGIGDGEQNTRDIVAECNEPGIAARLTSDYVRGTVDDWYLPTTGEFSEMYLTFYDLTSDVQKAYGFYDLPGNFASSVELSDEYCGYFNFGGFLAGVKSYNRKGNNNTSVRPIRSFSL